MHLKNLAGVSAKTVECDFFWKTSEIMPIIEKGIAATSAGKDGAMEVWRDDSGNLRGNMHQHLETVDAKIFESVSEMKRWASETLKKIGSPKRNH